MNGTSTAVIMLRIVVSLAVVLAIVMVAARMARRGKIWTTRRPQAPVEIVARHALSRRAQVVLVRAGDRGLVLGVTDAAVQLLAETDADHLAGRPILVEAADDGRPVVTDHRRPVAISSVTSRTASLEPAPSGSPRAWTTMLEGLRERTVRRS